MTTTLTKVTGTIRTRREEPDPEKADALALPYKVEGIEVVPNDRLDEAVRRVLACDLQTKVHGWRVGAALKEIHEEGLWKLRVTAEGKQAYRSFEQFAAAECRYSSTYAYGLIDVAKAFSEDDVLRTGIYKLMIVARTPPEAKERLLQMAKEGATAKALREEAKKVRHEVGTSIDTGRHGGGGPRPLTGNEGRPTKNITIAQTVGKRRIPLWKEGDPEKGRARVLSELPGGRQELTNRVSMRFELIEEGEGLALEVYTEREE